jgi:two-component system cell cycle response regulator
VGGWDDDETRDTEETAAIPVSVGSDPRPGLVVIAGPRTGETHRLRHGEQVIGRGTSSAIPIGEDSASRAHAKVTVRDGVVTIEDLASRNGTYVNGEKLTGTRRLEDGDKIQIGRVVILKFTYLDALDDSFQRHMFDSALRDGLTKVFNKRYLIDRLTSELRFATRHGAPLAVMLLDLDHFKQINDTYGHLAGDAVLVDVAQRLNKSLRTEDVLARYGGEEFAIVLRGIVSSQALLAAERMRATIESRPVVSGSHSIRVTTSIGVATFPETPAVTVDDLFHAADKALYEAKRSGRNCVRSGN